MCKDCENKELEMNEEQLNDSQQGVSLEDMSREELLDVVYSLLNQKDKEIEIDSDLTGVSIDKDEFAKGVKDFSYIAGAFTVMNNVGYPKDLIHEYLINERTIKYQLTLNEQTCKNNKEVARIQEIKTEQNQI